MQMYLHHDVVIPGCGAIFIWDCFAWWYTINISSGACCIFLLCNHFLENKRCLIISKIHR